MLKKSKFFHNVENAGANVSDFNRGNGALLGAVGKNYFSQARSTMQKSRLCTNFDKSQIWDALAAFIMHTFCSCTIINEAGVCRHDA